MLNTEIAQQVSFSLTPLGRLPSKPKPNLREHCNFIILKSSKQLEGPKGARVKEDGEKDHDESDKVLRNEDEPQEKNKSFTC